MKFNYTEVFAFDAESKPRVTHDGYLVAMPRVARTGIQIYSGKEVGKPEMERVRVYRPADQVFNKDSMHTFAYKPITDDHPREPVNSKNWRDLAVGSAGGEVARDGEFVRVPMTVMDAPTIKKVHLGKVELSVGYQTDLKWESGVTPDTKEAYDAIQTDITVNHIAIVKAARGGAKLRIGDYDPEDADDDNDIPPDRNKKDTKMTDKAMKSITVDGIECEMTDVSAQVVQRQLTGLAAKATDLAEKLSAAEKEKAAAKAEKEKDDKKAKDALDAKEAEVVTLKKQLDEANAKIKPEALDALVKDRAVVVGKAKAVLGAKIVTDGKSEADLRREVVASKLGDTAKDWSDEMVKASFDTLTAGVKVDAVAGSAVADTARAFSAPAAGQPFMAAPTTGDAAKVTESYNARDKRLQDAWKGDTAGKA